jgi:5-methylcytosine-specific restriction enzyme subunit McrC
VDVAWYQRVIRYEIYPLLKEYWVEDPKKQKYGPLGFARVSADSMAHPIPIQNIYYLLLYAWNRLPEGKSIDVKGLESPNLPNLLMKVLLEGVKTLQRRGLDRGYLESDEDLVRPRGRMCLGDTISRGLLSRVQVACRTDDLSYDVLHNRIVKSTLELLVRAVDIDAVQRNAGWTLLKSLPEITSIVVSPRDFNRIQLHANNSVYSFLLRVCALVQEALLPELGDGRYRFREIIADPQTMGLIFQDFVRNFYRLEQTHFNVKSEQFDWPITHGMGHGQQFMPSMNTDVSLYDGSRTIHSQFSSLQAAFASDFHNLSREIVLFPAP